MGDILRVWQGGIVFYGCIIGGLIGSVIYWYRHPFPFRAMADAVAPAASRSAALVGRVGCPERLLLRCCFQPPVGRKVSGGDASLGAARSRGVDRAVGDTFARRRADAALCRGGRVASARRAHRVLPGRRRDGEVMALLMVTYPVTRFVIEAIRGDEPTILRG